MFRWLKRRAYTNETLATLMAMTLMLGHEGRLLQKHPGIQRAIRKKFEEGTTESVAATYLSATLMADAIERDEDTARKQIVMQLLVDWAATENPRSIRKEFRDGTLNQDMLLTRLQWLLLMGLDLLTEGKIDEHDYTILKSEIYGSLNGEPRAQRTFDRIDRIFDEAFLTR